MDRFLHFAKHLSKIPTSRRNSRWRFGTGILLLLFGVAIFAAAAPAHSLTVVKRTARPGSIEVNLFTPMLGLGEIDFGDFLTDRVQFSLIGQVLFGSSNPNQFGPFQYTVGYYGYTIATGANFFIVNGFYAGLKAFYSSLLIPPYARLPGTYPELAQVGWYPLLGYRWDFAPWFAQADIGFGYSYQYTPGQFSFGISTWGGGDINIGLGYSF